MKLIIESLDELCELSTLIAFGMARQSEMKRHVAMSTGLDTLAEVQGFNERLRARASERDDALETQEEQQALDEATPAAGEASTGATTSEKPKRTRRTKEQIAADNAALEQDARKAAQGLEAIGARIVDVQTDDATHSATVTVELPATVETVAAKQSEMSDVAHLKLCREFIATHGMPKYEQSFVNAGLPANIMLFNDADRAKHLAELTKIANA